MDFILNKIPPATSDIYVDASSSQGVGGQCGEAFFAFPQTELGKARTEFIARQELLACMLAIFCFADAIKGKWFRIHTDNENVYFQLTKGRSSNISGTKYLAIWEMGKYILECKASPRWIPSDANSIADRLSRGGVPDRFHGRGNRKTLPVGVQQLLSLSPVDTWKKLLSRNKNLYLSTPSLI